jgi:site-specific DNA-methyltransferase (adenine-specific)
MINLHNGDCLEVLKSIPDNSVDAIVTDPPYGLSQHSQGDIVNALTAWLAGEEYTHGKAGFMGKSWDSFVPSPAVWKECYRVLKHGGHMAVFAGARTQDLMTIALRLSGFEMRDNLLWLYGSGFPKGQNIAKGIEKLGLHEKAKKWEGYNTGIKPAYEPIIMARKPIDGTVVNNVLKHGVGGLNIDACRVGREQRHNPSNFNKPNKTACAYMKQGRETQGRSPANIILDGSDSVEALFPYTKCGGGVLRPNAPKGVCNFSFGSMGDKVWEGSEGSASRYFYHAKASKADRDEGVNGLNIHPTVKPTELMRYIVRLVSPPEAVVLDPFMGSGSTGKACSLEGKAFIGIERDEAYFEIAKQRIEHAENQYPLFKEATA